MFDAIRRLIQRYGFFKREPVVNWLGKDGLVNVAGLTNADAQFAADWQWQDAPFYTEEKRRNERLAAIASEISALNVKRLKAKEQKKNQKVFEDQMTALMAERLRIETGKEMGQ